MLILTVYADEVFVARGIEAGVQGYMLKDSAPKKIVDTVQAVYAGQTVLPANG